MTLAAHVRILARGQGRARSMTMGEAYDAMRLMMHADADPEAVGAILMLMRMKGETAEEIAGFAAAARDAMPDLTARPALDWPSYAAGRSRGLPWFLLSAKLVAAAGVPVLLHGWNSHQGDGAAVRAALPGLGIVEAESMEATARALERDGIAYLPLEHLSPRIMALLRLRDVLGLRSCINTVCRMLNPGRAPAAVQGVFHPSYRELQADAAKLLRLPRLTVLKGGAGEFEHHPAKDMAVFGLREGESWTGLTGRPVDAHQRLADAPTDPAALVGLWNGTRPDAFAEAIVLSTAALALETAGIEHPEAVARNLWSGCLRFPEGRSDA